MLTMQFEDRHHERAHYFILLCYVRGKINGDAECTREYNRMGSIHDIVDSVGATLLHYSVILGDKLTTRWLLDYGLDIDAQTKDGITPLMVAAANNHEETVRILIKFNAKIDLVENRGETVLMQLSIDTIMGSSIPGALLMKLVDKCETAREAALKLINAKCPLFLVVLLKNTEIIQFYLDRGVEFAVRSRQGLSALHVSVNFHDLKSVELLLRYGADINATDLGDRAPVWYMRQSRYHKDDQLKILKILLDRSSNLTTCCNQGYMQIHSILRYCGKEAIRLLLQSGIDLCAKDYNGKTFLHYLAINDNPDVLEALPQHHRLDINARTNRGLTALHLAAAYGRVSTVQFLLDRGAEVNAQDKREWTPLFYASSYARTASPQCTQRIERLELLFQYGSDAQYVTSKGETIFDIISQCKSFDSVEPVLAYLAILEITGTIIKNEIGVKIHSDNLFEKPYNRFKQQLEQFKKIAIFESVTMFELLTESEEKFLVYMRNELLVLNLKCADYEDNQNSYYHQKLQMRTRRALRKVQLKRRAADALCEIMQLCYGSYPSLVDKILHHLSEIDLLQLAKIRNACIE